MRQWAGTSAKALFMAAGFVAVDGGVAFADSSVVASGNDSVLGDSADVSSGGDGSDRAPGR